MTAVQDPIPKLHRVLMILALALAAYWPVGRLGFLWDDHVMIEANPALREWSPRALKHDFTTDVFDGHGDPYYRPAQTLLNRIDYTIWGLKPFGYHLTNWIGHALNAILFQELALAMGLGDLAALLAACLFAVHPMPVEQLMIIAGRAELYGLTFLLTSLLLLLREEPWSWALGYVSYMGALLFKESALVAPLFLASLFAYRSVPRSTYWRVIPYLLLSIPYLFLRQAVVGPLVPHVDLPYIAMFFEKAFPRVVFVYARLILVPWNLHSHRMMPHLSHAWPLLLGLLFALPAVMALKKARLGLWGLAWFLIALLPKTPIMIYGNFILDHWAYPASIGIFLPLAAGYAHLWKERQIRWRYYLSLTFFPLLIVWALFVHLNVALRGTDEKMYRWALNFTESHPIKYNLGILLLETGRAREAIPFLEDVYAAYPEDHNNLCALAKAWTAVGHPKTGLLFSKKIKSAIP